jgi:hypothetical protein
MLACLALAVVAGACTTTAPPRSAASSSTKARVSTSTAQTTTTTAPTTTTITVTTTTIDPGLLAQTMAEPPVGASLRVSLEPLWHAIVTGATAQALPVFFPESAYLKMKQGLLPDPASDYIDRLIGFYKLDITAYHLALGGTAPSTRLIGVTATAADAAWIGPGDCENLIGYWHLPGVRFVYDDAGTVKSFAVASLISWRGVWYVVHLGPNPRPVDVGTVDQPSDGPGIPGPPGGC